MKVTTIGLDLAKRVFQLHWVDRVLIDGLDGDETHLRPSGGLADSGRIGRIVLAMFAAHAIRRDELRRDQFRNVPERRKLACPVMRTRARFHRDHARRQRGEEFRQLVTSHIAPQRYFAILIDTVHGENVLSEKMFLARSIPTVIIVMDFPFRDS